MKCLHMVLPTMLLAEVFFCADAAVSCAFDLGATRASASGTPISSAAGRPTSLALAIALPRSFVRAMRFQGTSRAFTILHNVFEGTFFTRGGTGTTRSQVRSGYYSAEV